MAAASSCCGYFFFLAAFFTGFFFAAFYVAMRTSPPFGVNMLIDECVVYQSLLRE